MTKAMIGVILWSDPAEQKAVFWCEDHGDLAYYDGSLDRVEDTGPFDVGDMVEFDLTVERKMRRAHNPRLILRKVCSSLLTDLRKAAGCDLRQAAPLGCDVVELNRKPMQVAPLKRALSG